MFFRIAVTDVLLGTGFFYVLRMVLCQTIVAVILTGQSFDAVFYKHQDLVDYLFEQQHSIIFVSERKPREASN